MQDQTVIRGPGPSRPAAGGKLIPMAVIAVCLVLLAAIAVLWPALRAIVLVIERNAERVLLIGLGLVMLGALGAARLWFARGKRAEAEARRVLYIPLPSGQLVHMDDARQLGAMAVAMHRFWQVKETEAAALGSAQLHTLHQEIAYAQPVQPLGLGSGPGPLQLPAPADQAAPLPTEAWIEQVNNRPDQSPHVAITGPSGSGKTTLALGALGRRPGRFIICTPKAARTDPWGGFPAVRLRKSDGSYAPIAAAIGLAYDEMLRRNASEAETADDWLTLVVDDYSTVIGEQPEVKPLMIRMLTLGRSCRVRVVILDTETNVKAWGLEGRGEARRNLLYVECEETTHRARMYRWGKEAAEIDTTHVQALAQGAQLADRAWRFAPVQAAQPASSPTRPAQAAQLVQPAQAAQPVQLEPTVQDRIKAWVAGNPWQTSGEIAAGLGVNLDTVRTELTTMARRGDLHRRETSRNVPEKYEYACPMPSQPTRSAMSA